MVDEKPDDDPPFKPWNPQRRAIEPLARYKPRVVFVPGKGMVTAPDDIAEKERYDHLVDLNEAILDSEAEMQQQKSFANVGYAAMKKRGP